MNLSPNVSPARGEDQSNGLIEVSPSELRPGDRVTFGDHTGWLRIRRVKFVPRPMPTLVDLAYVVGWPRRFKGRFKWRPCYVMSSDQTAWVQR